MNHTDEITFLNRLVEDLKKEVLDQGSNIHRIDMARLNQAAEAIARLEQCSDKTQELHIANANNYELHDRLARAEVILERSGYRHCDIPACNCNGYHK